LTFPYSFQTVLQALNVENGKEMMQNGAKPEVTSHAHKQQTSAKVEKPSRNYQLHFY
jgi:hypothetical protein